MIPALARAIAGADQFTEETVAEAAYLAVLQPKAGDSLPDMTPQSLQPWYSQQSLRQWYSQLRNKLQLLIQSCMT